VRPYSLLGTRVRNGLTIVAVSGLALAALGLAAQDAPKAGSAGSASDLAAAAEDIVKNIDSKAADDEIARKGYTLALVANAVAEADGEAKWKAAALGVRDTAITLAKGAKSQATVDKALKEITAAIETGKGAEGKPMKYLEIAPLEQVMKEVNDRNRPMTKNLRGTQFARSKEQVTRDAHVWAVLASAARTDTKSAELAKKPQDDFDKYANEFFNSSRSLAAAAKKGDQNAASEALKSARKACADCHSVYRPDIE